MTASDGRRSGSQTLRLRHNPLLYQINTRVWLADLSRALGRPATLDDVPDADLDGLVAAGFDLLYLLGVWQTGEAGRRVSRNNLEWREEFAQVLPDLSEDDICGSCFAITGYTVAARLGGDDALARFRARLRQRGLGLILDFVPNHTAPDHPWTLDHPEYYIRGSEEDLAREPQNYCRRGGGETPGEQYAAAATRAATAVRVARAAVSARRAASSTAGAGFGRRDGARRRRLWQGDHVDDVEVVVDPFDGLADCRDVRARGDSGTATARRGADRRRSTPRRCARARA